MEDVGFAIGHSSAARSGARFSTYILVVVVPNFLSVNADGFSSLVGARSDAQLTIVREHVANLRSQCPGRSLQAEQPIVRRVLLAAHARRHPAGARDPARRIDRAVDRWGGVSPRRGGGHRRRAQGRTVLCTECGGARVHRRTGPARQQQRGCGRVWVRAAYEVAQGAGRVGARASTTAAAAGASGGSRRGTPQARALAPGGAIAPAWSRAARLDPAGSPAPPSRRVELSVDASPEVVMPRRSSCGGSSGTRASPISSTGSRRCCSPRRRGRCSSPRHRAASFTGPTS